MTRDCEAIASASRFLLSKFATENDARLVSQVKIWAISTQVFDTLGTDVDTAIPHTLLPQILRFAIQLDTWRADWNDRFSINARIGDYPRKGVGLHFHFAKLFLCSHVFRGKPSIGNERSSSPDEIANTSYFITMITFAAIFMLKVALKYPDAPYIHRDEIHSTIERLVRSLEGASANMHRRHLLVSIASSLAKIHAKLPQAGKQLSNPSDLQGSMEPADQMPDLQFPQQNLSWLTSPSDIFLWESYDFLSFQPESSGLDFDFQSN